MNHTVAAATQPSLARWCGWVMVAGLGLIPLIAWLGPLAFAPWIALMGLASLPALRMADEDRPVLVLLLAALMWAAVSTVWSPYHPSKPGNNTALKLALQLPIYWAAVCGARRAAPELRKRALSVLAWGAAALGVILCADLVADARIYEALRVTFYGPIRHDLAQVNVAHACFVMALLAPLGLAAAVRIGASPWLGAPMLIGAAATALRFKAEAPALAVLLAAGVATAVWRWPRGAPPGLALGAVVYSLAAPLVVIGVRATGAYETIRERVEPSWAMRMDFWAHAVDWLRDHPVRGWGLDASRMFGPGIVLHPHDGALQIWLELGVIGAALAAGVWWLTLSRLARPARDPAVCGVAAAAAVYLLFGALNFGVWQDWWLALGALVAIVAALLLPPATIRTST